MSPPPEEPRRWNWAITALLVLLSAGAWTAFCVTWTRTVPSPESTLADPRTPPEVSLPRRRENPVSPDPGFQFIPTPEGGFQRQAAAAALAGVNIDGCHKAGDPAGATHVKVTFAPDGYVKSAVVDVAPLAGTGTGACIAERFRGARVPSFDGASVTVGKSVEVPARRPACTCKSGDPLCSCVQ